MSERQCPPACLLWLAYTSGGFARQHSGAIAVRCGAIDAYSVACGTKAALLRGATCCAAAAVVSLHPQPANFTFAPACSFAVRALLTLGGYYSKESRLMRAAQRLYTAVTEQAANPQFLSGAFAAQRLADGAIRWCSGEAWGAYSSLAGSHIALPAR